MFLKLVIPYTLLKLSECAILQVLHVYLASGSGRIAKNSREEYCGIVLPQLLLNRKESGIGGGDFNSVMDSVDSNSSSVNKCTNLGELVKTFNMKDCYRELMPKGRDFSRYSHGSIGGPSMSRIYQ